VRGFPQTVARALRSAPAVRPSVARPEASGRSGFAPRSGLTAAELRFVRETYGAEPIVREWLLAAGLA
jgi:hypothetical protein